MARQSNVTLKKGETLKEKRLQGVEIKMLFEMLNTQNQQVIKELRLIRRAIEDTPHLVPFAGGGPGGG